MTRFRNMIWLLIIPLLAFGIHKHYISLTKIEFIKEEKAVQITMKFFLDDIELALENRIGESMELASKYENKLADKYLETYIRQKFKIWIDEKEMTYNFLGKEYDNNEVFFYIELQNIDKINTIEVENSMLFETYAEQQNYIKFTIEETQKTFILVKSNVKEMLKL
ncbi:MAG: hypothetical protein GY908_02455 [Flavobacteriales bacterium]|nr:hypothetical protein [Flavobacteriales bacterium]